jgi:plastocyanin
VNVVALASCPTSVAATMTTGASAFSPMASTVSVGSVVKLTTTVGHNVIPNSLMNPDPVLNVGQNATKCFQFNTAGTYGIQCGFHGFAGTITVQ